MNREQRDQTKIQSLVEFILGNITFSFCCRSYFIMEFPNLGQQCSWRECKQLDFLPVTCDNCRQIFCKEHYLTSAHDCKCLNEFFKKQTSVRTFLTDFPLLNNYICINLTTLLDSNDRSLCMQS